jgi:hypothetical protein
MKSGRHQLAEIDTLACIGYALQSLGSFDQEFARCASSFTLLSGKSGSRRRATDRQPRLLGDKTTHPPPKLDLASTGKKMYDQASLLMSPAPDAVATTAIDPGTLALIWFLCLGNG